MPQSQRIPVTPSRNAEPAANPAEVKKIEELVDRLLGHSEKFTEVFLARLERGIPSMDLGGIDRRKNENLLMSMLSMVTSELRHPDRILPSLHGVAITHLGSGFSIETVRSVRDCLTQAARECLADEFCQSTNHTWQQVSNMLIDQLMRHARLSIVNGAAGA